ncbi:unnamed protein product [Ceutorhynchus assimilis]|uniref:Microtubule-associated protein futsch n=1 Tax=Ceutorhynchus assimilis TaxID=467358 RepID=A0A9N9N0G3_9CUCU|nr:unnamed protein product [Ceutorhynchus assimilis]
MLGQTDYLYRHNQVAAIIIIHQQIAKHLKLTNEKDVPYYKYNPHPIIDNESYKLPEIIFYDKVEKKGYLIDVAVPNNHNIQRTTAEIISKYSDLRKEMTRIWKAKTVQIIGERLIQFASENLVTEILIHPAVSTLSQCVRNLLSSFTRHRHIIHAGYTFQGNGSWALQDGTFSYSDFAEAFQEIEVQRVIHAYENGISIDLHCTPEGDWTRLPKEFFTKFAKVRVNPTDVLTTGSPSITSFTKYLEPFLVPSVLEDILESSDVVGNIRFSRPTLYVFPGGQGDAALFGINGFNMLLDGGYSRKACFWDFVRHLDRLDAVLMTRLNNSSLSGVSSVLKRKKQGAIYPQLGHFFCNIQERKSLLSPDGDKDKDPLIISLLEEGQSIIQDLQHLNLSPQTCYRDSEPIILYHKVGHGTLNMFVLSPDKNSRDVREFLQRWHQSDSKLFAAAKTGKEFTFPLQNLISICALLVWQPANPNDTITRILYPGSTPQKKIFDGLDRLKSLECMKHPVCTVKSVMPVKKTKQDILDKLTAKESKPITEKKIENKVLMENSIKNNGEMNGDVINKDKPVKKSDSLETDKEKKPKKAEERPPTPKKTIENKTNGETKAPLKPSPSATPAKSTKDANNRKVIESKKAPVKKEPVPKAAPVEVKAKPERKPISRRPKAIKGPPSPMKKMSNGIQKPDSLSKRGKLDKEGTTDSSTVSTPSAEQDSILKKDISKLTPEEFEQLKVKELEELKEEQEAVKEIEAVFRKGETRTEASEPGVRKIKEMSIDDNIDTEEYLIIEKEEVEHDSLDQNEDEMQKLVRDSEESEKQRKLSGEEEKLKIESQEQKIVEVDEPTKTPEELDAKKPEADKKELTEEENKEIVESHPEEKVSANIESGATTTAPTLPEDERMTLDEIKEDIKQVVEEKHVKEETKEKEIPIIQLPQKSQHDSPSKPHPVVGIPLDKQKHVRDIVKTPDEVADLPVHEEADYQEFQDDKKSNEVTDKEGGKKEEKETDDVEDKVKLDETKKGSEVIEKKKETGDVEPVAMHGEEAKKESEVIEIEGKEEKGDVVKAEGEESKKVPQDEKQTDKDVEAPKHVAKEIPIESNKVESDSKLNDSVISVSQKTEEIEKSDILEKADIETNEDAVIVQEEKLKESMDEEWVVISKDKEEDEIAEEADKVLQVKEQTKKETIVSDFISKEVEHEEQTAERAATAKPDFSLPLVPAADFKSEKEMETTTTESSSHELRKGDEVENVSSDKEKDDIQALIEEADKRPMEDTIVERKDEEKINEIKETKHVISEIDTKLQDLKKEVSVPVEEIKLDKGEKDLTKIEEPGESDTKPKLDDITKIDTELIELNGQTEEVIVIGKSTKVTNHTDSAEIVETSSDHAEPAITEKAEVFVKKSTRSPEHAESVVLPDSSPEDDGPLVLKALDIDKLELGRKSPAEREDDVQLIVASVAEVLKSEAPLEEFASKLPFTQELRETHITTQDSPIVESKSIKPEDIIPPIPEEPHEEEMNGVKEDDESGTVHRMLVTTSSEDGGEEIEICPAGTITFSKSSESSGRSSPEPSQKTQSQKSSIVETLSDTLSTVKQVAETGGKVEAPSVVNGAFQVVEELEEKVDNLKDEIEKSEARNVDDKVGKAHDVGMVKSEEIKSADVIPVDAKLEKEAEIDKEKVKLDKKDYTEAKIKPESDEDAEMVPEVFIGKSSEKPKDKVEAKPASSEKEKVTAEDETAKHDVVCKEPAGKEELAEATEEKGGEIPSKLKEEKEVTEKETKETPKDVTAEPKEAATKDIEAEKQDEKLLEASKSDTSPKSPEKKLEEIHDTQKKETDGTSDISKTVDQLEKDVKDAQQKIIEKASEDIEKVSDAIAETKTEVSDKITGTISGIFDKIEQHVETAAAPSESSSAKLDDSQPETNYQSIHKDESEDVEVPIPKRRQSIIEKTQDFIETSGEAFEGVLSYITTKAHSVLDDIIKSDIDSNKLSGESTPESKELKDSTKLSSLHLSDVDKSRKSTPDLKESKESSGKSTPDPKEIVSGTIKLDSQTLSQEASSALSRKSTPEPKEVVPDTKRDSIDIHKSSVVGHIHASPTLSGKSTPDPKESIVDSREASIDSKAHKALSGKSTPEPKEMKEVDPDPKRDSIDIHKSSVVGHIHASPTLSGKSTPDPKESIVDSRKASIDSKAHKDLSGKSTPEAKDIDTEKLSKDDALSGKATPEPQIQDLKRDSLSGKSTPEKIATKHTEDLISDSRKLSVDHKQKSPEVSGKSTPEKVATKDTEDVISDSRKLSVDHKEKAPEISGKSTPEKIATKDTEDVISDSRKLSVDHREKSPEVSRKSTPEKIATKDTEDVISDSRKLSVDHKGKAPEVSGKSTPEKIATKDTADFISDSRKLSVDHKENAPEVSGKSTPEKIATKDTENVISDSRKLSVDHKQQSPEISGKSTPEKIATKDTEDLISDSRKLSVDHKQKSPEISGKSTPELKEAKDVVEDAKKDTEDDSKASTQDKVDLSPIASGKSTPVPKEVIVETKKDAKDVVEDAKKDSKDLISDSNILNGEGRVDSPAALSGKSTPEPNALVADITKDSKDSIETKDTTHVAENAKKDVEDLISDSKIISAGGHSDASRQSTLELKEVVDDSKKDSKESIEPKDEKKDTKDSVSDSKILPVQDHIDASPVLSGKSTPESKEVVAAIKSDVNGLVLSGKSTPEPKEIVAGTRKDSKASLELKDSKDSKSDLKILSAEGHSDVPSALSGKSTPEPIQVKADTKPETKDSVDSKTLLESTLLLKESKDFEDAIKDTEDIIKLSKESLASLSGKTSTVNDLGDSKQLAGSEHIDGSPAVSRKSSEAIEATKLSEQSPVLSGKSSPEPKKLSGQSSPSPSHDHVDTPLAKSTKSTVEQKDLDAESKKDEAKEVMATKEERRESIIEAAEEFIEKSEKALGSMFSVIGGAAKSVLDDIWADTNKEKEDKASDEKDKVKEAFEAKHTVEESGFIKSGKSIDASKNIEKEKDQLQGELKVDKDVAETEKKQTISEEFKVNKETIEKEEKEIEDKVMHISETLEKVSELAQSVSFETCQSIKGGAETEVIEKEEMQLGKQAEKLKDSSEDLSKLNGSVTFEKCHPSEEYQVDKETVSKVEKKIEDQATHLSETVEEVSELAKSISFEKCHQKSDSVSEKMDQAKPDESYHLDEAKVDKDVAEKEKSSKSVEQMKAVESKVDKDILEKEATPSFEISKEAKEKDEKIIDDQVKRVSETAESLSNLAKAASFEKCTPPEEFNANKDAIEKQEKKIEAEVSQIKDNVDDLDKLTKSVSFDKCKLKDDVKEHKDEKVNDEAKSVENVDSNKVEHLKQDKESSSKLETDACKLTITTKSEQISQAKESIVLEVHPISSQTEKCEKESMEKTSSSLKITQEPKKLSISDVEISIKTDIDHKDAISSFLDNERAVFCDSTDAKVYIAPKEVEDSSVVEAASVKSSPEIEISGKATPPTQPVSPVVTKDIQKSPSSKLDSGLSEQTETDEEDLSTKSQIAHSQSDLDELDMKMDPMSMSFYGALPEEHEGEAAAPTYLYEITKAKYGADVKLEEEAEKEDDGLMTASFIGDLPSSSTVADKSKKDAVDSWGKPLGLPAPTYLYEVTKAKFSSQSHEADIMTSSFIGELPTSVQDPMTASVYFGGEVSDESFDPIASWGKPLGLPSPAPPNNGTPKKEKKLTAYVSAKNKLNEKRAESPSKLKAKKVNPIYVDLTYVPHHGNHYYSYVDFFRRIRARYYVFSGLEPSRQVYDALLEAKQTWEEKELGVLISNCEQKIQNLQSENELLKSRIQDLEKNSSVNNVEEYLAEAADRERRKLNLIFVNIPESDNDPAMLQELLTKMLPSHSVIFRLATRLGKLGANRPRLLKVSFNTFDQALLVLKNKEVTIIPTYDTDILGYWVAENEEQLSKFKIDLAPSASRCTINLQDHETSCSAYRLEF